MRNKPLVLVADDDPAIRRIVKRILELNDYEVIVCSDGAEAVDAFLEHEPQFVILDMRMPEMDGLEVCRRIREGHDVPIIILTALEDESDVVDALEAGADDYVRKPFGSNELVARVRAVMRRTAAERAQSPLLQAGEVIVDPEQHSVRHQGAEVYLSRTEFSLLVYLIQNQNRVLTHDQILEKVWGADYVGFHHTLRVAVSRLRQRFGNPEALPIESISGVGYRLRVSRQQDLRSA